MGSMISSITIPFSGFSKSLIPEDKDHEEVAVQLNALALTSIGRFFTEFKVAPDFTKLTTSRETQMFYAQAIALITYGIVLAIAIIAKKSGRNNMRHHQDVSIVAGISVLLFLGWCRVGSGPLFALVVVPAFILGFNIWRIYRTRAAAAHDNTP